MGGRQYKLEGSTVDEFSPTDRRQPWLTEGRKHWFLAVPRSPSWSAKPPGTTRKWIAGWAVRTSERGDRFAR
jgi:hypothetical protein